MLSSAEVDAVAPLPGRRQNTGEKRPSLVQQKLHAALLDAEKTSKDLSTSSFKSTSTSISIASQLPPKEKMGLKVDTRDEDEPRLERAVVRYRQAAASVSFVDPATNFGYTPDFMPGVHFYTFLASKDNVPPPIAPSPSTASRELSSSPFGRRPQSASRSGSQTSRSQPLRLCIPDTIIYGETGRAIWIHTDPTTGFIQRATEFSDKQVLEKFTALTEDGDGAERVIVFKEPQVSSFKPLDRSSRGNTMEAPSSILSSQGSQLRLLTLAELKTLQSSLSSSTRKSFAIQRFVKCAGSKAFVLRSIYDANKPSYAWMISNVASIDSSSTNNLSNGPLIDGGQCLEGSRRDSNPTSPRSQPQQQMHLGSGTELSGTTTPATPQSEPPEQTQAAAVIPLVNRLCTNVQGDHGCTFVKLNERACIATSELTTRIVKHIEQRLGVQLQMLVADYTKDCDGTWWLLQVKAFQVKNRAHPGRPLALPLRLRLQYLTYRDSQLMEEGSDSDGDGNNGRHSSHHGSAAALIHAHRQTRKLVQCKCCLAAYPKSELSFKMTLKMINDMLMRIRARTPPDAPTHSFLAPVLVRELPDASLAYESWSVCSYCYAIYERDQQLQKVEAKFSSILGIPSTEVASRGLSRVHENRSYTLDPSTSAAVLPDQLTLCRLILVINGIYDIPAELYDAETTGLSSPVSGLNRQTPRSQLYLRITALGYTECIPIDASDIMLSNQRAPRGAVARRRTSSTVSLASDYSTEDNGIEDDEDGSEGDGGHERQSSRKASRQRPASATSRQSSVSSVSSLGRNEDPNRNYSLPLNLIRTMQFFAPRTPLQAKLKETSGITPFLTDSNSIHIQLIRSIEPPLEDPTVGQARRRPNTRRTALIAEAAVAAMAQPASMSSSHSGSNSYSRRNHQAAHTVVLGSTKIRMAQFQSAYVTKMDYYACMAFTGEMLNVKGNVGLERLRYVDTKLLMSQFRLRAHNGVFIPDDTYTAADPLSSEWMDCLRISFYTHKAVLVDSNDDSDENAKPRVRNQAAVGGRKRPPLSKRENRQTRNKVTQAGIPRTGTRLTASASSLATEEDEEMDQELEQMIDRANDKQQKQRFQQLQENAPSSFSVASSSLGKYASPDATVDDSNCPANAINSDTLQKVLLSAINVPSPTLDTTVASIVSKSVLSPRTGLAANEGPDTDCQRRMWTLVLHLNQAHNLYSREHSVCRWECSYSLFGQKRSAIERRSLQYGSPPSSPKSSARSDKTGVEFSCTHKFFALGSRAMMQAFVAANARVVLQLRNDMYASTRQRRQGEFYGVIELGRLQESMCFDAVVDILPASDAPPITPREAATIANAGTPYLSVSVQLSDVTVESEEITVGKDFVEIGVTSEGLVVLRKV